MSSTKIVKKMSLGQYMKEHYWLYILLLPGIVYLIIFNYIPMYGIVLPFIDYNMVKGFAGSPWVGLENYAYLFKSPDFLTVFKNSVVLSMIRLAFGFPAPIILALLINEIRKLWYKRIVQTVVYVPHFVSWVVIAGIVTNMLSADGGSVNYIIKLFGGTAINFLIEPKYFRSIIVISEIWKEAGWGTIIYLAAMTGIDPQMYEAATVDGAGRFRQMLSITIPCIVPTMIVLLVLRMGSILNNGFEQVFLLYSPSVYEVGDVLETFSYRLGLMEGRFSFASAVGMFQSLIGLVLIVVTNKIANKSEGGGLW